MRGPIERVMHDDHRRLAALLDRAVVDPDRFDHEAFEAFRAGLLRHIGIEEKILLAYARARTGAPLPIAAVLRLEHGALASLLVPTPDHALVREIRSILAQHDPREEGPGGMYATVERLAGDEVGALLDAIARAPEVPPAKHFDGESAARTAQEALERSGRSRPPR